MSGVQSGSKFRFEAVPGIFSQGDPETDWTVFDYTKCNFGLIPRGYSTDTSESVRETDWVRFTRYVDDLVLHAPVHVTYKLLYMSRHGEGEHNVAQEKYGTTRWDDYWSKLQGDGELFWSDAHLTSTGRNQALAAHTFFAEQLATAGMPAPQSYYVSPLFRCLQTCSLTFSQLHLPQQYPFDPLVKELLRECLGEHTCDRRSAKSHVQEHFPKWRIEDGFTQEDELWRADHRETFAEHDQRTKALLDDLFTNDSNVYLSLSTHSGTIASHLRVLGHREFRLSTGGMIPVLVKATRIE